ASAATRALPTIPRKARMCSTCIPCRRTRASMGFPTDSGRRGARAFTLIELIVVMAILATLLTLAVPRYFRSLDRSREAVLRQNLSTLRDALDKYYGDLGRYPDTIDDLVAKRYLRAMPVDPITERSDTWQVVPPPDGERAGRVYDVHSGAPGKTSEGAEFSQW